MKKMFFSYMITLLFLTFFSYLFVDPNLFYLKNLFSNFAFQQREITTFLYIVFVIILYSCYFYVIHLFQKNLLSSKNIKILLGVSMIFLFFAYPAMLSYDIFNYIATAKITFLYKENPYLVMPTEIKNEPLLAFMHAPNKIALYGPVWIMLTIVPYIFGFTNFVLTLFTFKLFVFIFYLGVLWVVYKFSHNLKSVLLFAFHPLVMLEVLLSSHNDIVMMFFALASFYLLFLGKKGWSVFFIILSIGIKYTTFFLLPVYAYAFFCVYCNKKINWDRTFFFCTISMMIIFFLSPLREEMYPWYAVWFLPFVMLAKEKKVLFYFSQFLSLGLLLRYIPFMYTGSYFGNTPFMRIILTCIPVILGMLYMTIKSNIWRRISLR